jgi:diadenosine tetraphosphate (Ap4A) HIT family hydrolase
VSADCPLCTAAGGRIVLQARQWRLVHAGETGFPAFYRLVWQDHVREFSQLARAERHEVADLLAAIESVLLRELQPAKVNLASLGNAVPHLHWHVLARFGWDSHFPGAVWAQVQREPDAARLRALEQRLPALEKALVSALPHGA